MSYAGFHIFGDLIGSKIRLVRCHAFHHPSGSWEMEWTVIAIGLVDNGYYLLLRNDEKVWRHVHLGDWEIKSV